jgi:hypothetical protein
VDVAEEEDDGQDSDKSDTISPTSPFSPPPPHTPTTPSENQCLQTTTSPSSHGRISSKSLIRHGSKGREMFKNASRDIIRNAKSVKDARLQEWIEERRRLCAELAAKVEGL